MALRVAAASAVVVAVAFVGCHSQSTFSSLRNEGVVPVSSDNPFVGSNLFLAKEMERSTYLYNFVKQRGAPQAIELMGEDESALEVKMLYAATREVYFGRLHQDQAAKTREWIIRGPYAVDRSDFRTVAALATEERAVFEMFGRREVFGRDAKGSERQVILPAFVPTPLPTPKPKPRKPKPSGAVSVDGVAATPTPNTAAPMNFDQKALIEARELAQRNPNGDLIHNVKNAAETFVTLSNWYAGSPDKAKAIADKNGLTEDAKLTPGTKLFVPGDLVKNPKEMK